MSKIKDFLVTIKNSDNQQIYLVDSPDGERIIGVKSINVFQNNCEIPILTFTAFCYVEGWVHLGMPPRGDAITVINDNTISMPSGKQYSVLNSFVKLTNDRREDPECTVSVYCKIQ